MTLKRLKTLLAVPLFALLFVSPVIATVAPTPASAATSQADCEARLLGIPPWQRGLVQFENGDCNIKSPADVGGLSQFIWTIVLNVIEMALFVVGFMAVGFIIFGGFQFLTGGSNPGQIEKARKTILNAVIGLAISMAAIGITNLIFRIING